jgi:hypothetical protein
VNINHQFPLRDTDTSNTKGHIDLPRHRWYYYKEGFSPDLVSFAIKEANVKSRDVILDPFNGSGTVTLTAAQSGYHSVGVEVNPFAHFLSKVKETNLSPKKVEKEVDIVMSALSKANLRSPLLSFSTFSETPNKEKWLFNPDVLNGYYTALKSCQALSSKLSIGVIKLALLNAAMKNCNAVRDGKCFRYRPNWQSLNFNRKSLQVDFHQAISCILSDLGTGLIVEPSKLMNGDSRQKLITGKVDEFKLCITSPPYLNSFDYTDVYRPELFLGEFISSQEALLKLRSRTIRSHASASRSGLLNVDLGPVFNMCFKSLPKGKPSPWQRKIPVMIQAYFEDMQLVLSSLLKKGKKNAQLWLVVSNSAYNDFEVPVDLILADIGSRVGWTLCEIGVLRNIHKRGSKYSPEIVSLRESVVIFRK